MKSDWLVYLGKRRPDNLKDQAEYDETIARQAPAPVAHDNGPSIEGHHLGRGQRGGQRK